MYNLMFNSMHSAIATQYCIILYFIYDNYYSICVFHISSLVEQDSEVLIPERRPGQLQPSLGAHRPVIRM